MSADLYATLNDALGAGELAPPDYPVEAIEQAIRSFYGRPAPAPAPRPGFLDRVAAGLADVPSPGAYGRSGDVFGANLASSFARTFGGARLGERQRQEGLRTQQQQRQEGQARMLLDSKIAAAKEGYAQRLLTFKEAAKALRDAKAERDKHDPAVIEAEALAQERGKRRAAREFPDPVKPESPKAPDYGAIGAMTGRIQSDPDVSQFVSVRDAWTTGKDAVSRNNSAGDIILMRMIAKTTDPTTGVREEEFRTFEGAQGTLARYGIRLTTDMWGGGRLTPYGRKQLEGVLDDVYRRKEAAFQRRRKFYEKQARAIGVDPSLVIEDMAPAAESAPKSSDWFDQNAPVRP